MKLSTRGIYGLEAIVYLAIQPTDSYTSLKTIALDRSVSVKYLEQIFAVLKEAGILSSTRGKLGGYQLARHPSKITANEVLQQLEIEWTTSSLSGSNQESVTNQVLHQLHQEILAVLSHYTIEDLAVAYQQTIHQDFVI